MTAGREFHPALKRYVSDAKIAIIFTIAMLFLLLVSHYGNHIHQDSKHSQHYIVEGQILKLATLETDCPENIHEISGGKEICQILRPCLHELTGVNIPLISMNISTKNSIRNTDCSRVSE